MNAPPPAGAPAGRRRAIRALGWGLRLSVAAYLGLLLVLSRLQTRLIFPGQATQGRPEAAVTPGPGAELVRLTTAGGDRVVALFGPALDPDGRPRADAAGCPSILFFYGNAMCLADARPEFDRFRRLGANVLVPDYVGYGLSGGTAGEAGCYATADAALAHLRSRPDVDPGRIVAVGWSLGAAVALDLAAREPLAGLAMLSPFTSAADMARRALPLLPAGWLLRHRFDSLGKIACVRCPLLIGHGTDDTLIPHSMADRLAQAAAGPVARLSFAGADHNEFFAAGGPRLDRALADLLTAARGPIPPQRPGPPPTLSH